MFSKTTEYALRATIFIAQKGTVQNKLGIEEISKAIDSPKSFTAKILQMLTRNNKVISSIRGPRGGFYMTESSKLLSLRAVIEAMEEDYVLKKCVLGLNKCSEINPCPLHAEYKVIRENITALFETKTIGETALQTNSKDIFINNNPLRWVDA